MTSGCRRAVQSTDEKTWPYLPQIMSYSLKLNSSLLRNHPSFLRPLLLPSPPQSPSSLSSQLLLLLTDHHCDYWNGGDADGCSAPAFRLTSLVHNLNRAVCFLPNRHLNEPKSACRSSWEHPRDHSDVNLFLPRPYFLHCTWAVLAPQSSMYHLCQHTQWHYSGHAILWLL